jgi:hypothetical protein
MKRLVAGLAMGLLAVAAAPAVAQCEIQKLTASDAAERDFYGSAVGAWGSTIVIGASGSDGEETNGNGRGDCRDIALGTSDDCNGDGIPDECVEADGLYVHGQCRRGDRWRAR